MPKERIIWADSLKGILILCVVFQHVLQYTLSDFENDHTWNIINSFQMPAFMTVSGWFAYSNTILKRGLIASCVRRLHQVLIPYLIWSAINWGFHERTLDGFIQIITFPDYSFWFLWTIFWISAAFYVCQWISVQFHFDEIFAIIVASIIFVGVMVGFDVRIFGFQFVSYYFLFYTLGYLVHRYEILQIKNPLALCVFGLVGMVLAWFWKMHELPTWMPDVMYVPTSIIQFIYRGGTALVLTLFLFGISMKFLNKKVELNNCINKVGTISLGIYVVHLLIIHSPIKKMIQLGLNDYGLGVQIALLFLSITSLSIIIVLLLNKNRITARLLLGKF